MDDPDEKLVNTVIALDVAFGALLRHVRDYLPDLAEPLREELESGSESDAPGLPRGANARLAEFAAALKRHRA